MCFLSRDAAYVAVCKERDELRKIVAQQAHMNQAAKKVALELENVKADRDVLQQAYDAMTKDLQAMSARLHRAYKELAALRAETNRLAENSHGNII